MYVNKHFDIPNGRPWHFYIIRTSVHILVETSVKFDISVTTLEELIRRQS